MDNIFLFCCKKENHNYYKYSVYVLSLDEFSILTSKSNEQLSKQSFYQ